MTTDQPNPSKPRRRWFQFSLRTLFVLVTVLCVWLAMTANRARKQREAVAAIEAMGGTVYYDYQIDSTVTFLRRAKPDGQKWLRELIGKEYFVSVYGVNFRNTRVTDSDLEHMKMMLTNLQWLNLESTQVTDAGLEHLKGLTKLVLLDIRNTHVTDEGVKKLQQALPNCEIHH